MDGVVSDWAHCRKQRHASEANSSLAHHKIPCVLPQHIYHSLPLVPVLIQMSPIHVCSSIFFKISFNIVVLYMLRSCKSFRFPDQNHVCISLIPFCAMQCLHLILIDFSILIVFSEDSKPWSSAIDVTDMCIELGLVNYRCCVGVQLGKFPDYVPVMLLHINTFGMEVF